MIRIVGRGRMNQAIIKQNRAARFHRQNQNLFFALFDVSFRQSLVTGSTVGFFFVRDGALFVGARNQVKTAVFQRRVHDWNPHRDHRIGVGVGPIRFVLMPRHRARSHAGHLGPHVINRIGKQFRPDQTLDGIQNFRSPHQFVITDFAVAPTAPELDEILIGQAGKQTRQTRFKRQIGEQIRNLAARQQLLRDLFDFFAHCRLDRSQLFSIEEIFQNDITFAVVKIGLLWRQKAGGGLGWRFDCLHRSQ